MTEKPTTIHWSSQLPHLKFWLEQQGVSPERFRSDGEAFELVRLIGNFRIPAGTPVRERLVTAERRLEKRLARASRLSKRFSSDKRPTQTELAGDPALSRKETQV